MEIQAGTFYFLNAGIDCNFEILISGEKSKYDQPDSIDIHSCGR